MRIYLSSVFKLVTAVLGLSFFGVPNAAADASRQKQSMVLQCHNTSQGMSLKEEISCACNAALKTNTIEALEAFMRLYGGKADSECLALASTALVAFGGPNDNGRENNRQNNRQDGGYGR